MPSSPDPRTTTATGADVRVRFCPSPTGPPHVGLIRTALFNWAYARHTGGTLVFRIEDTDAARDSEESYQQLLDALRWLGHRLGRGRRGRRPHAPYRQSQRHDIYREVIDKLIAAGARVRVATRRAEEIEARQRANGRRTSSATTTSTATSPTSRRPRSAPRAGSRRCALRVPDDDLTYVDLIRGEVTFPAGSFPDFVLVRADGVPLYTAREPGRRRPHGHHPRAPRRGPAVLDRRGSSRSTARWSSSASRRSSRASPTCRYVHRETGNKKLSKRDPESDLFLHRETRLHPRGPAQLPLAARLVDRRPTATSSRSTSWSQRSTSPTSTRTRPASTRRRPSRSTATTSACWSPATSPARIVPYLQAAGLVERDADPDRAGAARGRRTARPGARARCSARSPGCWASCSAPTSPYHEDALASLPGNTRGGARRVGCGPRARSGRVHDRRRRRSPRRRPDRGPGAEAAHRLRPAAGRAERTPRLAAALRVDGAPRQGRVHPPTGRPGRASG